MHAINDNLNRTKVTGNIYERYLMKLLITTVIMFLGHIVVAQEMVAPLRFNPAQYNADKNYNADKRAYKTTALSLPFFEDFTGA